MKTLDTYRFNAETEPTDEQLKLLMAEVADEVRESNRQLYASYFADIRNRVMCTR